MTITNIDISQALGNGAIVWALILIIVWLIIIANILERRKDKKEKKK